VNWQGKGAGRSWPDPQERIRHRYITYNSHIEQSMNTIQHSSLCSPDNEKSCFACCPPIRPADYEHIEFRNIIRRVLLENTEQFKNRSSRTDPITGYSCWALGYTDKEFKRIGCLLHPAQNREKDLRYRTGYGDKCRRETCPEEKLFSRMELMDQAFWLHLADGLDSFSYSSRKINPLFNIIGWGKTILKLISTVEQGRVIHRNSFFSEYCLLSTKLPSRGVAYLINQLDITDRIDCFKTASFKTVFEEFAINLSKRLNAEYGSSNDGEYLHMLGIEPEFSDFLRISAGIRKIRAENTDRLKGLVDEAIESFKGNSL
jgi:hypothetical protein